MKVLITTDLFTTATNGVVTSVMNLRDELTRRGHDVRVLTISDSLSSHKEDDVSYIRSISLEGVYPNVRMPVSYRHALIREMAEWKPDIIHSQCEFFSLQFARYISRKTGAPIVHTYHTLYEQYASYVIPSQRIGKQVVKLISRKRLANVKRIVAPTYKVKQALLGYGLENDIAVIPSGIALSQHKQRLSPDERWQRRALLGLRDEHKVLLNLGRLGTEKNLHELIDLFAIAAPSHPQLRLMFVGDGPARESLENAAREKELDDRIFFIGMVPPHEVQYYYQLGDIFVNASTSETQGLTYIEAAANGLPLLCREDPCINGVLRPGENGYTYTSQTEFLAHLDAMLRDRDWLTAACKRSEEIAATYDKSAFGDAVEAMYLSVLQKKA